MLDEKIIKLKALINSSPLLNPAERAEWLALLEVMNDKQVVELERILASSKQTAVSRKQEETRERSNIPSTSPGLATPKSASDFGEPRLRPPSPSLGEGDIEKAMRQQMPKLSHIMNLPKFQSAPQISRQPLPGSPKPASVAAVSQPVAGEKLGGFFQKIQSMLAEKELPAGKQDNQRITRPQSPLAPVEGGQGELENQKALTSAAPASISQSQNPNLSSKTQTPPTVPKPKAPILPTEAPPVMAKPGLTAALQKKPEPPSGLHIPQTAQAEKNAALAAIKQHQKTLGSPASTSASLGGPVASLPNLPKKQSELRTLEDLAGLTMEQLKNSDINALAQKIRPLAQKFGYFDVVFNLEKSPIFKAYITTGQKLLTDQVDFTELQMKSRPGEYLGRTEFEKFADLLMKIQVG